MTQTITAVRPYEAMTVTVPPGLAGGVEVRRFAVTEQESTRSYLGGRGRGVRPGTYTGLYRRGYLWMSDTPDEKRDHLPILNRVRHLGAERVLVNGLGLGMVVAALLACETVQQIDVVEIDPEVIALVGPHYEATAATAGKTLAIHQGDAYAIQWPAGTQWDCAWHDVWPDLCTDNLPQMATLHRRYGRRVKWQGSWGRSYLEYQRGVERRRGW
jgi:hypothetical protein